jgi:hypothetical protein
MSIPSTFIPVIKPCLSEHYDAKYKRQLMALGIIPGDPDSATTTLASLKVELDQERSAQLAAQIKVDVLTRAVKDLKISTLASPPLERVSPRC